MEEMPNRCTNQPSARSLWRVSEPPARAVDKRIGAANERASFHGDWTPGPGAQ